MPAGNQYHYSRLCDFRKKSVLAKWESVGIWQVNLLSEEGWIPGRVGVKRFLTWYVGRKSSTVVLYLAVCVRASPAGREGALTMNASNHQTVVSYGRSSDIPSFSLFPNLAAFYFCISSLLSLNKVM